MTAWLLYEGWKKKEVAIEEPDFAALTRLATPEKGSKQLHLFAGSEKPARDAAGLKKAPGVADRC